MAKVEYIQQVSSPINAERVADFFRATVAGALGLNGTYTLLGRFGHRQYEHTTDYDVLLSIDSKEIYLSFDCGTRDQISDVQAAVTNAMRALGISGTLAEAD